MFLGPTSVFDRTHVPTSECWGFLKIPVPLFWPPNSTFHPWWFSCRMFSCPDHRRRISFVIDLKSGLMMFPAAAPDIVFFYIFCSSCSNRSLSGVLGVRVFTAHPIEPKAFERGAREVGMSLCFHTATTVSSCTDGGNSLQNIPRNIYFHEYSMEEQGSWPVNAM